jgi:hypothetical protein
LGDVDATQHSRIFIPDPEDRRDFSARLTSDTVSVSLSAQKATGIAGRRTCMMDDILKAFLTSLGTVGVLLALLWWWLQRYLDRRLAAHYNVLEARLKGEAEAFLSLRKKRLEKTAELLPKLQQAASACRSHLRGLQSDFQDKSILQFWEAREAFVDLLYGAQLLLLPQTYDTAHAFKSVLDKVSILVGDKADETKQNVHQPALDIAQTELNGFYSSLETALRKDLRMLEHPPGSQKP